MKATVHVLNDSEQSKTVRRLRAIAGKAAGKTRADLQNLAKALEANPTTHAARRRKPKEGASMAKKQGKRTAKRTAPKSNPTNTPRRHRHRVNPTGDFKRRVASINFKGIAMKGLGTAAGMLAGSFITRQAQRLFPDMNAMIRDTAAGAVVAGAAVFLGGSKGGFLEDLAVGAVAKTVENLATTLAPGVFAGADDEDFVEGLGGWDPQTGEWIPDMGALEEEDMQGISYLPGSEPSGLSTRPLGM